MNLQTWAWIFAGVFITIGILGFVPGITTDGMLLGIFEVDTTHNLIHILSGLAAAAAAMSASYARLYFQIFGVIYGLVAVIGFMQGDTVLGLFSVNMADHWLHVAITAVALYLGFFMKGGVAEPQPMQNNMPPQGM